MSRGRRVMPIAAVVLAAGASTRLGSPKQLVELQQETLLDRAVRMAREAGCSPVVVVLGAAAEVIRARCAFGDVVTRENADWAEGIGSSIRVGVAAVGDSDACIVMTCDMPAVTADHLRNLMVSGEMTASSYAGRRGVPAYFPRTAFAALLQLRGDAGARELLRHAHALALPGGEMDVDTAEDVEQMIRLLESDRDGRR